MPISVNNKECCGCRACEEICPRKAITMVADKESFMYPVIDDSLCVDCHLCEKVCPLNYNDFISEDSVTSFVGTHKSNDVIYNSSSGGAFMALCQIYTEKGYSVCGVKFDEHLKVIHDFADNLFDCEVFRKSKYVQSNTNHCFSKVADKLKKGEGVLFSGVSCQVAALNSFLKVKNVDTSKLITVNLLCHGVPSQKLFDDYIIEEEEEEEATVYQFRFKNKEAKNEEVNSRTAYVEFSNGHKYVRTIEDDPFLKGYYWRLFYRPSCALCNFTKKERISDFTIADAWKIEQIYPEYNPLHGVSLLLLNTPKAKENLANLNNLMNLKEVDSSWALNSQRLFRLPTSMHPNRNKFFKLWPKIGFGKAVYRATKSTLKQRLAKFISSGLLIKFRAMKNRA